jgi:hypothetical protein
MRLFREYVKEDIVSLAETTTSVSLADNPVRDSINNQLATITAEPMPTPYHALEMVRKVLAVHHIFLPKTVFLDGISGHETFKIQQFGNIMGARDNGEIVSKFESPYNVFFEYATNNAGAFDIFCEIVTDDELEEIMADIDEEQDE